MGKIQSFHNIYWKTLTLFVRIVGCGFVACGLAVGGWGCFLLIDSKAAVNWNGTDTTDIGLKLVILFSSILVIGMGVLLIKAKPYRSPKP